MASNCATKSRHHRRIQRRSEISDVYLSEMIVFHAPSFPSSIPICDKRYRRALRVSPSSRAAWLLFPFARFRASSNNGLLIFVERRALRQKIIGHGEARRGRHVQLDVAGFQHLAVRQHHAALQHILQLTHVARPMIFRQPLRSLPRKSIAPGCPDPSPASSRSARRETECLPCDPAAAEC